VDQAIEVEEDRVVCIRFGHDWDPHCMVMDETLYGVQGKLQNFAVIYLGKWSRPREGSSRVVLTKLTGVLGYSQSTLPRYRISTRWVGMTCDDVIASDDADSGCLAATVVDVRVVRPVHLDVLLPVSDDADGVGQLLHGERLIFGLAMQTGRGRNKHIMIDLGTGNNNKM
jgi:hypothetical protein